MTTFTMGCLDDWPFCADAGKARIRGDSQYIRLGSDYG
jgi:hypothetical protein